MKNCIYIIDGQTYTYQELIAMLQKDPNITDVSDIVFSKTARQQFIFDKLNKLKKDYIYKRSKSIIDEEPELEGAMTLTQLIDSQLFRSNYDPSALITPYMDTDEYITNRAAQLIAEQNINQEQAEYIARQEVEHWDIIGEDAKDIHQLLSNFDFRKGSYDFLNEVKGTRLEAVGADMYASIAKVMNRGVFGGKENVRTIKNLNLEGELRDALQKVVGHIDYLLIDEYGNLELYNFKVSTQKSDAWADAKKEKYKYQLALLKQLLAHNGINVKNIGLNIIPITVAYNEDFSKITSVSAEQFVKDDFQIKNGKYVFNRYDRIAKELIASRVEDLNISSDALTKANETLQMFFPEKGIKAQGIQKTIQEQIKDAKKSGMIKSVNEPNHFYDVIINGVVHQIKSPETPTKNQEIIDLFTNQSEMLEDGGAVVASRLVKDIISSYKLGFPNFDRSRGFAYTSQYLNTALRQYFKNTTSEDGTKHYDWEFIDDDILLSANILAFKNNKTDQLDIISLSPYDLNQVAEFSKNRGSTLAGYYLYNREAEGIPEATYGNIEVMRTMALLNEVIPNLDNCKLGKLKVLSPVKNGGKGGSYVYNFRQANVVFNRMLEVALKNNQGIEVENNFSKAEFKDPLEILIQEYQNIINSSDLSSEDKATYSDMGFKGLIEEGTNEAKVAQLLDLLQAIRDQSPSLQKATNAEIKEFAERGGPRLKTLANLLILTNDAYSYYSGDEVIMEKPVSTFRSVVSTANRDPRRNVRMVTSIVSQAIDRIHYDTVEKFTPIRKYLDDFYKSVGYSSLKNSTLGNQEQQFSNMFEKDEEGNNLLVFKNPYKDASLSEPEKVFLKKALFTFAKIRCEMKGIPFNYTDENDGNLQQFIKDHWWYFNVPLEKASSATRLQHTQSWVDDTKKRVHDFFRDPKTLFREYLESVTTEEERDQRDRDLEIFRLSNRFAFSETNDSAPRANYILKHGSSFFETNVENLLIDFLVAQETYKEMNKALIRAKSITFSLYMLGEETRDSYDSFIKDIDDYLKLNVFNQSIMEPESQVAVGRLAPLRGFASRVTVAADFTKGARDIIQGLEQNCLRTITKYMTDITGSSLRKAYKEVMQNILTNVRSVNKISLLNKQFNISFDVSNPSESLKTGRAGFFNYQEYAYSTLKRPDFLNRMTLFVAKCIQDGCFDALSEQDGRLIYDWRKDKRFEAFASGDQSRKEYFEQRGLYLSKIRMYNQENPDKQLSYTDDLPTPYSNQEIQAIKNTANTIYGAYDKHIKAKYENLAIGWIMGQFTTWMNSWYNNYFMKPGAYEDGVLMQVQDRNEKGELLYFDNDGNITTTVTDAPVYKYVPMIVQGVWYTLKDSLRAFRVGGRAEFMDRIWKDPIQRRNFNKLLSDLFMLLLLGAIYKLVLTPAYKEFKKGMKDRDPISNAVVEVLYKGGESTIDDFKGPYAIVDWASNSRGVPFVSIPMNAIQSLSGFVFGDKTAVSIMKGYIPFVKSFKDTLNAVDQNLQSA